MCLDAIDINYEVLFGRISEATSRRDVSRETSSSPYSSPAVDTGIAREPFNWKPRIDIREVLYTQVEV